jgi:LacI family transcriptional regulator
MSSVDLAPENIGYQACDMLDRLMHRQRCTLVQTVQPGAVVIRQSTQTIAVDDPYVAAALGYIREHDRSPLQVSDVARQVSLSRRSLERRFRMALGRSVHDQIVQVRLERVRQLLSETDLKLDAIATRCGFPHTTYMATLFKHHVGQTPGQYRQSNWRHPS